MRQISRRLILINNMQIFDMDISGHLKRVVPPCVPELKPAMHKDSSINISSHFLKGVNQNSVHIHGSELFRRKIFDTVPHLRCHGVWGAIHFNANLIKANATPSCDNPIGITTNHSHLTCSLGQSAIIGSIL